LARAALAACLNQAGAKAVDGTCAPLRAEKIVIERIAAGARPRCRSTARRALDFRRRC